MTPIISNLATSQGIGDGQSLLAKAASPGGENPRLEKAIETRDAFMTFFGETFFKQMIKAMRTTTGDPAYFHGGRAEEIFQGQLDQTLSEELSASSAQQLAGPMFRHQFPQLAAVIAEHESGSSPSPLADLSQLSRR